MENKPEKCATCKPLTNGDKIRAMTDEELAEVLADFVAIQGCPTEGICCDTCTNCWLKWLRSPVEGSHE